jgi:hypothetical protein
VSADPVNTATYKIVRFRFDSESEVVDTGLTLAEAQAHCQRDDTHGEGWFDGYLAEQSLAIGGQSDDRIDGALRHEARA